ncbi:hypothetical protein [Paenibacillus jilunlii]|uniref:hypothetical protein n=1 Tax=Paenibacillus jilunlii TaxID=682956 RepID=UPI000A42E629|nr:hypothetical protein [Paenibacillus jilunlii]
MTSYSVSIGSGKTGCPLAENLLRGQPVCCQRRAAHGRQGLEEGREITAFLPLFHALPLAAAPATAFLPLFHALPPAAAPATAFLPLFHTLPLAAGSVKKFV